MIKDRVTVLTDPLTLENVDLVFKILTGAVNALIVCVEVVDR